MTFIALLWRRFSAFLVGGGLVCVSVLVTGPLRAGGGPENLVLVVNAQSQESLSIANEYVQLRNLPARNVIYLRDITKQLKWDLKSVQEKILRPVLQTMEHRKLMHVDYIVYSSGFPTAVDIKPHRKAFLSLAGVPPDNQRVFSATASLTSLTYFAPLVLNDDPQYLGLRANFYYRVPAVEMLFNPFGGETQQKFAEAIKQYEEQDYDSAAEALASLVRDHPGQIATNYWLARCYARQGKQDQALQQLIAAMRAGWSYREMTRTDEAFEPLAQAELFQRLLPRIANDPFDYAPTSEFSHQSVWGPNGSNNAQPDQGFRYYLSTMLSASGKRGLSEAEALRMLRTSVPADYTQPSGTFYFTSTSNVRTRTRQPHFQKVVEQLKRLGHDARIVKTNLPKNRQRVAGLTIGTASYKLAPANLQFVPGAIAENFTSFGGALDKDKQTPLTECLRYGAAGSSGTVAEPFAILDKFPHPMIHVHYARGSSLAEAFYQSVRGPYMLLIMGDALCRPWAEKTEFNVTGLPQPGQTAAGELDLQIQADLKPGTRFHWFLDGLPTAIRDGKSPWKLDTRRIPDGFHELRAVAIATDRTRSRTSQAFPLLVDNAGQNLSLEVGSSDVGIDDNLVLNVAVDGVSTDSDDLSVLVFQNARQIATIDNVGEPVTVPARVLGRGTSELTAALKVDSQWIRSRPVEIRISY